MGVPGLYRMREHSLREDIGKSRNLEPALGLATPSKALIRLADDPGRGRLGNSIPVFNVSFPPPNYPLSDLSQVYIIGHVPPGVFEKKRGKPWFRKHFNQRYTEIIQKHHAVIAAQFFGHHHTDSFRMFYDNTGTSPGIL